MRDVPHPAEGTRYPAFHSYNKAPLSIRSNHPARGANQDHGAVGTGNDVACDREDCGLWSCNGGSVGMVLGSRQVIVVE